MNNYRGCILQQNLRYIKLKSCWLFEGDCNHQFSTFFLHAQDVSPFNNSTPQQKKNEKFTVSRRKEMCVRGKMCMLADRCLDLLQGKLWV
jgi:hypothetical protein